jgi:hypothetical protein
MQREITKLNKKTSKPLVGDSLTVVGFGRIAEGGPSPKKLQNAGVLDIDKDDCEEAYPNDFDKESMMCAAGEGTDGYVYSG